MPLDLAKLGDDYDWPEVFSVAARDSNIEIDPKKDIKRVIASIDGEQDNSNWQAVIELNDGRYAWISSGCDYTGWGCQDSGSIIYAESLAKLFNPYFMPVDIRDEFADSLEKETGLKVKFTRDELERLRKEQKP
jgi:hypothetical protein